MLRFSRIHWSKRKNLLDLLDQSLPHGALERALLAWEGVPEATPLDKFLVAAFEDRFRDAPEFMATNLARGLRVDRGGYARMAEDLFRTGKNVHNLLDLSYASGHLSPASDLELQSGESLLAAFSPRFRASIARQIDHENHAKGSLRTTEAADEMTEVVHALSGQSVELDVPTSMVYDPGEVRHIRQNLQKIFKRNSRRQALPGDLLPLILWINTYDHGARQDLEPYIDEDGPGELTAPSLGRAYWQILSDVAKEYEKASVQGEGMEVQWGNLT